MKTTSSPAITTGQIKNIERLIRPHIRRTPVLETRGADFGLDHSTLIFKLELCQHAGSFKTRGAFANLLAREIPIAGVVAASGGNHGVAVAYAAAKLGIPVRIFVPKVASPSKIEKIRSFGAALVVGGDRYADAFAASERWAEEAGALQIHAYDQPETLRPGCSFCWSASPLAVQALPLLWNCLITCLRGHALQVFDQPVLISNRFLEPVQRLGR